MPLYIHHLNSRQMKRQRKRHTQQEDSLSEATACLDSFNGSTQTTPTDPATFPPGSPDQPVELQLTQGNRRKKARVTRRPRKTPAPSSDHCNIYSPEPSFSQFNAESEAAEYTPGWIVNATQEIELGTDASNSYWAELLAEGLLFPVAQDTWAIAAWQEATQTLDVCPQPIYTTKAD